VGPLSGLLRSLAPQSKVGWVRDHDLLPQPRSGLNFAGIRHLMAQKPCWALKPWFPEDQAACPMRYEYRMPCWNAPEKLCTEQLRECYCCNTYRGARSWSILRLMRRLSLLKPVNSQAGCVRRGLSPPVRGCTARQSHEELSPFRLKRFRYIRHIIVSIPGPISISSLRSLSGKTREVSSGA
jgi:hypothetical protein